jgi:hypothetical protein
LHIALHRELLFSHWMALMAEAHRLGKAMMAEESPGPQVARLSKSAFQRPRLRKY